MTAQERAGGIINWLAGQWNPPYPDELEKRIEFIAGQLEAYAEERIKTLGENCRKHREEAKAEGRRAGLEEALAALEAVPGDTPLIGTPKYFAAKIVRGLLTEEKK